MPVILYGDDSSRNEAEKARRNYNNINVINKDFAKVVKQQRDEAASICDWLLFEFGRWVGCHDIDKMIRVVPILRETNSEMTTEDALTVIADNNSKLEKLREIGDDHF
jgi:hypothetical protein